MKISTPLIVALLVALSGCAGITPQESQAQPGPAGRPPSAAELDFKLCESESFMALHMGRNYMLQGRRDKASVLAYIRPEDKPAQAIAERLFGGVATGAIRHHADFAAETLSACTDQRALVFTKPREQVRLCFARVDIPFFVHAYKEQGMSQADAVSRVTAMLKDERQYPPRLTALVASHLYKPNPPEPADVYMKKFFWTCVFSQEWSNPQP